MAIFFWFKSFEAFLESILDNEERNFQTKEEFVGTLAKRQAPKHFDQNGFVKTGKTRNSLLLSQRLFTVKVTT